MISNIINKSSKISILSDENQGQIKPKYFTNLLVIFFVILFVNNVIVYKLVQIGNVTLSAASLIFPLTYWIADIITEVYGYKVARELIWLTTIYNVIFAALITLLLSLPSPHGWRLEFAFHAVFNNILFICIVHVVAAPASYFLNAYLISKWKIVTKGKYFWFRSVLSTFVGEFVFSIIMTAVTWYGNHDVNLFYLIMITYMTKCFWAIVGVIPASLIVRFLKKSEEIDIYDVNTNFNPFSKS